MNQKERLVDLIELSVPPSIIQDWAEGIADYLLEQGVIVPPCKVGDVVYLTTDCTGDMKRIVTGFTQDCILSFAMQIPMSELGKTVFTSREDAVKALRGDEGNENTKVCAKTYRQKM